MTNNVHKKFDWILKTGYDFIGKTRMVVDFLPQTIQSEFCIEKKDAFKKLQTT